MMIPEKIKKTFQLHLVPRTQPQVDQMLEGIFMNGEDSFLDKETLDEFALCTPLKRIVLSLVKGVMAKSKPAS